MTLSRQTGRLVLATLGFTSTIAQLVLVRELVAVLYGNELILGVVLAAWMLWVAIGAWGPGAWAVKRHWSLSGVLIAISTSFPLSISLIRRFPTLLAPAPGVQIALGPAALGTAVVLMPLCLLLGTQFAAATRVFALAGGTVARAYLFESLGAVIGGMFFSLVLVRWLDPFQVGLILGVINLTLAFRFMARPRQSNGAVPANDGDIDASSIVGLTENPHRSSEKRLNAFLLISFCLLILLALVIGPQLHTATLRAQYGPDLTYATDSPYGRLVVLSRSEQRVFYENGLLAFETQSTHPEEAIHLPLLAHPDPRHVLLIGGVIAGDLRTLLLHPVTRVVAVELDAQVIKAAHTTLPKTEIAALDDTRVSLVLDDGRRYLQRKQKAIGDTLFNVIVLDIPAPSSGALNRYYTREFFAEVRHCLAPDGVFALGLPSAENYWSPELMRRNASIYRTLREVFPQVLLLPGDVDTYIASNGDLSTDPAVWHARLTERDLHPDWVTPTYLTYLLTGDRLSQAEQTLMSVDVGRGPALVRINRDLAPICYYYDLALWASRFHPWLRSVFEQLTWVRLWWFLLPLAGLIGLTRWQRTWATPLIVAGMGTSGMVIEVALLLGFQAQHGTLYQSVGILIAAFMGGHTLGVWAGGCQRLQSPKTLPLILGLAAIGGCGLAWVLTWPLSASAFGLLALLAGGFAGVVHPLTLAQFPTDAVRTARHLYTADLLGGCLGAFVGGAFLVPLLGISQTCITVALVLLAGVLMVI